MSNDDDRKTIPSQKMTESETFESLLEHINKVVQSIGTSMLELHSELQMLRRSVDEQNEIAGKRIKKLEQRVHRLQQDVRRFTTGNGATSP